MHTIDEIIVIGTGNWGLALASLFSQRHPVRAWAIDEHTASQLNDHRDDPGHTYKYAIPPAVHIETKYAGSFDGQRTLIIMAVPSSQVRRAAKELGEHADAPLVLSVSKGFDVESQRTMSEVIRSEIPGASVLVLTGPTIANEVAEGKPTRAVLAGEDLTCLALVKQSLRNDVITFEISRSPAHHEVCAALKGIVAIAVGMADGLELGANVQGILMTQGLKEMAVIASFFGIPEEVAFGTSGAGDLITTCISPDSRNRQLGSWLAKGLTLEQTLEKVRMTVEGVAMSQTIETLWALDVSIPLIHMVNGILHGKRRDIRAEITRLIATP